MSQKKIVILPGDGIGQEVVRQAEKVLLQMAQRFGYSLEIQKALIGGAAYEETGTPFPDETLQYCRRADAILLGAVGGPQWETLDYSVRPERGLLKLRSELGLFANLRPAVIYGNLVTASTLKPEVVGGADILVVRELTGGIYFGHPKGVKTKEGKRTGFNTMIYSEDEIRRIAKIAFEVAMLRGKKLVSVDKANVLEVTELWRDIVNETAKNFPEVKVQHMYVDNAAMQLIRDPKQFDTIVTGNMFGDILSDAAAMITGSIGMLPSASLGGKAGLYEPVHGSAPDIAGQDKANPLATILSVGMMFQYSFQNPEANSLIKQAVIKTIENYRTQDIMEDGKELVGCSQMGELIVEQLS